jgi:hypothetical protein
MVYIVTTIPALFSFEWLYFTALSADFSADSADISADFLNVNVT